MWWGCSLSLCRGLLRPSVMRSVRIPPTRKLKIRVGCACRPCAPRAVCTEARASALESGFNSVSPAGLCTPRDEPFSWEEAVDSEDKSEPADYAVVQFNIGDLVALLRQENAKDICVISLPLEMKYADYLVIVSASSTRHLHAMAQFALKAYKQLNDRRNTRVHIEGKETEDWLCIDFRNIIVHFMLPETREIYELEKLWTLRCYDDQLDKMTPETLPEDFIFGLQREESALETALGIGQSTLEDGVQNKIEIH